MTDRFDEHASLGLGGPVVRCPIRCGECCSDGEHYTCRHLGPGGCDLDTPARPTVCNEYLCETAKQHRPEDVVNHGDTSCSD